MRSQLGSVVEDEGSVVEDEEVLPLNLALKP